MIVEVWLFVASVVLAGWAYSRWCHNYWSSRGIPTPPYLPFLGHMHRQLSWSVPRWIFFDEVYYRYRSARVCGLYEFFRPVLMVTDPDLLRNIFVKDFDHFVNRRPFLSEKGSIVNDMLGNQAGDDWKSLRSVMSPAFTSGKMRGMFPIICDKADALVSVSLKEAVKKPNVDMKHNFGRYTMDVIAACAFGIECNSLVNEDAEFARVADQFFSFSFIRALKFTLLNLSPKFYRTLGLKIDPPSVKFFTGVAEETIKGRKAGQRRGDFLDLLLDERAGQDHSTPTTHKSSTDINQSTTRSQKLTPASNRTTIHESAPINDHSSTTYYLNTTDNDSSVTNGSTTAKNHSTAASSKKVLTDRLIVAQSVLFLIAGYDTTASTLAMTSFLLAKNPIHQQRLRQEMQQIVEEHGNITYHSIMEAKFLDACLMESLRMYPPASFIERQCTKTYKLPGTKITLHPGDLVTFPFWSLHRDPRYWPEPEIFRPDRFLPENKANIVNFTHMPFGMGPRNCIAMRFALMEAKVALAKLILAAELSLQNEQEELKLEVSPIILRPAKGSVNLVIRPVAASPKN
ncbi:cytochrome P450 9e2-like isoform X2 [Procambarus clarkii]|uniref:cytochrome P450 9e2-like isoform X2 n=2 Tax=Procambarus clarkii TaxID=6728 RepID=UPI0037434001